MEDLNFEYFENTKMCQLVELQVYKTLGITLSF